jgi:hypothetical protein
MQYSKGTVIALATILGVLGLLTPGRAEAITVNWRFGLVGVVFDAGQAVQVNATHIGDPQIAPAPGEEHTHSETAHSVRSDVEERGESRNS